MAEASRHRQRARDACLARHQTAASRSLSLRYHGVLSESKFYSVDQVKETCNGRDFRGASRRTFAG